MPLDQGPEAVFNIRLAGVGEMEDIPEFKFSYTMLAEKEPEQAPRRSSLGSAGAQKGGAKKPGKR